MSGPRTLPKTPRPAASDSSPARPSWVDVELLLEHLAETGEAIPTALAPTTRITTYERGRRLRLEGEGGSNWLEVESIQGCWETFERLGKIRRRDVLDPGRCSAFMLALFRQVPGVVELSGDDPYLVLPA